MSASSNQLHWTKRLGRGSWEISRRKVSVMGRLTDAQTGAAIRDACVRLLSGRVRFLTATQPNGHFHFLDLPAGEYALRVELWSGVFYGETVRIEAAVFRDVGGNMKKASEDELNMEVPAEDFKTRGSETDGETSSEIRGLRIKIG